MCGIIGFNWEDKFLLNKMLKEISHRGIDGFGKFTDKEISLGHRRLSILDLSKAGKQPMSNEDETIWIVFNGEVYNFEELKKTLKKTHDFKSNTDTEVLIHLYEEEGVDCLKRLNGMFAFCIYDSRKKILFLARDRVGIKPLYYYKNKKKFAFCSEIKGILQDKEIERKINFEGVSSFLSFRANITEESCFKSIKKLMPGHYLIYDLKKSKISEIRKYWNLRFNEENKNKNYLINELKSLLHDSVKKRLISDVPYGAYLSGGVDSGTIVSIMNRFCSKPIETFSVGFEKGEHNEINGAKFLSEKLNTNHHELLIKEDSVKFLPEIIYHLDEPMSDPTSIPIYFLSEYTKRYCTVVLTGEGADEVFAGYPQYKFMKIHKKIIAPLPFFSRKIFSTLIESSPSQFLNKFFKYSSKLGEKGKERFKRFLLSNNFSEQYLNLDTIFNEEEKNQIMKFKTGNLYSKYSNFFKKSSLINDCLKFDFTRRMVEDLLMKLDKNTMAFSVEGRVPFLDYRIVEIVSGAPQNFKAGFLRDKILLREAIKGFVPEQTRKRKKQHFFVPIDNWFKNELLQLKEELLSKNYLQKQKIFNFKYIQKTDRNFKNSPLFYSRQLWSLITFQIWYKQYIENEKIKI